MESSIIYQIIVTVGMLILAITIHEFSHVAMARVLGDDLGTRMGRFTLDPLRHIDPVWTVLLPALLIGISGMAGMGTIPFIAAGKPSPYNAMALKKGILGKKVSIRTAEMFIAAAGPLSNLLLAIVCMVVIGVFSNNSVMQTYSLHNLLLNFVYLNTALFVFNLIPVPPLDGTKMLMAFLPIHMAQRYEQRAASFSMMLFVILIFGGGALVGTAVHFIVQMMSIVLLP